MESPCWYHEVMKPDLMDMVREQSEQWEAMGRCPKDGENLVADTDDDRNWDGKSMVCPECGYTRRE